MSRYSAYYNIFTNNPKTYEQPVFVNNITKTERAVCINSIAQTDKSCGFKTRNNEFIQTVLSVVIYCTPN